MDRFEQNLETSSRNPDYQMGICQASFHLYNNKDYYVLNSLLEIKDGEMVPGLPLVIQPFKEKNRWPKKNIFFKLTDYNQCNIRAINCDGR